MCKRSFDILIATLLIILLLPVMTIISLMVFAQLGGPILFRQIRPGNHEKPFELFKFRTMRDLIDETGAPLGDEVRLTRFGRWLRSSSLDELPELINVIRGEMSLVGPRPLLMEYLA